MGNPHRSTFCMVRFDLSAVLTADAAPLPLEQDDASGHPNDGRYTYVNRDRLIIRSAGFAVVGGATAGAFDVGE